MASAWELIGSERQGRIGRRPVVAKTFRLPDGSEKVFTLTGDAGHRAAACVALTPQRTVVLAEQYRPGPERVLGELPGGAVNPGELVRLALTAGMSDPGGVLLALPYLLDDPGGRQVLAARRAGPG